MVRIRLQVRLGAGCEGKDPEVVQRAVVAGGVDTKAEGVDTKAEGVGW